MNKKLLRTSVIASVMAMAFTASAWAYNYDYDGYGAAEVNSTGKNTTTGVMWDAGWYAPDGKFYTYVQADGSINTGNVLSYERESNSGRAIGLSDAQIEKLQSLGLDHNSQADSVWFNDAVPSYAQYFGEKGFNAESVAKLLADNLKFNADLNYTLIEWEEAARKEHDKDLDTRIKRIQLVDNGNNTFTFTNGAGEAATISFTDTNTKLVSSTTGLGFTSEGNLSLTVVDEAGRTVTGLADIGTYVKNNAGNATYQGSTTINQQISQNTTNITNNTTAINNINNNNVSKVTVDGDQLTFYQKIDGVDGTFTYTDKHITGHTMSLNGDKIVSSITTNFGSSYNNEIRVGDATINYAGDIVVQNQDGSTTQVTETIENVINNNYNKIVNVENNNVSYISQRTSGTEEIGGKTYNVEYYEVTQKVDGQDVPVKIKDTTLVPKQVFGGARLIDVFKSDVNIQDDSNPEVQAMRAYINQNALVGRVDPITGMPQIMMEFEDTSGNVVQGALDFGSMIAQATDMTSTDGNIIITGNDSALGHNYQLADEVKINKSVTVNNLVKINENGKITGVTDGEISATSTDAINGSQLWQTNQNIDRLGSRVDKVGAGAAALAALHPMDFDPDDKLQFSAGVGNYGGETAAALGAFYRPTEKVMFSVAGTMGNGENMVNAGVTFALDRKNNVSNSRVAMAREIQDLRDQVAQLTALVTQLAGRSNPALLDTVMFPDVPENHWAYDYIDSLQKRGIIEGYPDGNFGGDRSCTRYEYAAMLYRALEKGFPVDSRLLDEFKAELGRIRVDRIKGEDADANKVERVRVNDYEGRDDYGSKLAQVVANAAPSIEEPAA